MAGSRAAANSPKQPRPAIRATGARVKAAAMLVAMTRLMLTTEDSTLGV